MRTIYKSPIDLILSDMTFRMEDHICKAVQNVGVSVDKEEMIRALQYDRGQYQVGFEEGHIDGYNQAMSEMPDIVRCKDCKHFGRYYGESKNGVCNKLNIIERSEDWFCADGEKKE